VCIWLCWQVVLDAPFRAACRCLANYEPVVDASGQDNILQCGEAWFSKQHS